MRSWSGTTSNAVPHLSHLANRDLNDGLSLPFSSPRGRTFSQPGPFGPEDERVPGSLLSLLKRIDGHTLKLDQKLIHQGFELFGQWDGIIEISDLGEVFKL
ncbi:MAG: hypothetical protein JWP89_4919 [Schlesneria sp.]|nr:hypothetical protein [Schlesneria sp.]